MSEMNGIPQNPSQQPQGGEPVQSEARPVESAQIVESVEGASAVEVAEAVEVAPVAEVTEVVEAVEVVPAVESVQVVEAVETVPVVESAVAPQPVQPAAAPVAPAAPVQPQHQAPVAAHPQHAAYGQGQTQPLHGSYVTIPANPAPSSAQPQAPTGQPYNYTTPADQRAAHQAAPAAKPASNKSAGKTFAMGFAGAALACCLGLGAFGIWESTNAQPANATHSDTQSGVTLGATTDKEIVVDGDDITLPEVVADKCLPSVVAIDVYTDASAAYGYGYGYGVSQDYGSNLQKSSLGSGVVLSEDGYIVTNNHVVEGADALKVTIEGQEYDAEIVGTDPSSDLAVIKAKDASGLTPMELGDSDDLVIGEWVMTLGSPFGFEQSVATGIVSATSRSQTMSASTDMFGNATGDTTVYANLIQTDAAINPGNSGGALVNAEGKLIGINTLITSYSGNYSGVGFAIPVNYAVNIAQQIIDGKTPSHAQLGVSLSTVTPEMAQRYGLASESGAYIAAVSPDSAAAEAGIEAGDIVTGFDGKAVESADDLMLDVRGKNPGDAVTLTVVKPDGSTKDVTANLGSDEASQLAAQQQELEQQQQQPQQGQGEQYGYGQGGRGGQGGSILDELFGSNR